MMKHRETRKGFALPAAVFGLVVVGVLVTGGFYVARQETRIGVANQQAGKALYMAERGVSDVIASSVAGSAANTLPIWADTMLSGNAAGGSWNVNVTRMSQRTYFLDGTGTVTEGGAMLGGATRRVGMIARVFTATIDPPAALTTQDDLRIGGSSQIMGADSIPSAWPGVCNPSDLSDKPGVLIDDTLNVRTQGTSWEVDGSPAFAQDSTITAANLLEFGDVQWDELVKLADITFATSETITNTAPDSTFIGGQWVCTNGRYNWGDPNNPDGACGNRFPIIYAQQNLNINSAASGQGILLIEQDLSLQGGYTFYGPVIVKGSLSTAGTGGHVIGGVIAANVDLDTSTVLGNAVVQYSSCSVDRAVFFNANLTRMRPLDNRSWVDLTNLSN